MKDIYLLGVYISLICQFLVWRAWIILSVLNKFWTSENFSSRDMVQQAAIQFNHALYFVYTLLYFILLG